MSNQDNLQSRYEQWIKQIDDEASIKVSSKNAREITTILMDELKTIPDGEYVMLFAARGQNAEVRLLDLNFWAIELARRLGGTQ